MSDDAGLPLRAENNPKFYSRFLWLGLGALGFSIFCFYDGLVRWPDQQVRGEAFMAVAEETVPQDEREQMLIDGHHGIAGLYTELTKRLSDHRDLVAARKAKDAERVEEGSDPTPPDELLADLDYLELAEGWDAKAAEEGWESTPPAKLRTDGAIFNQFPMAIGALLLGAHFLFTVYRTRGRWFQLDESGITSRWGESFSLDQITEIEKSQWRKKGIARLRYNDAKGRQRTFVVDDYKYHRKTTDRILWHIENAVGFDKIVGGKPGPDPDAKPEPEATQEPTETEASS